MAQDIEEVRREIREMHASLEETDFYELLGVKPETEQIALKQMLPKAFRDLAKKWHVDRYSNMDLGEDKAKLQEIFSTINTAQQTLLDPDKRAEYDMERSGANTDIGSIIDAEASFRKGKAMLETGSYKGAHLQFEAAHELNPEDIEYKIHLLYTEYLLIPKNDEGTPLKRVRAQEIFDILNGHSEELSEKDWMLVFMGVIARGLGRDGYAENLFRQALMIDSRNHVAQRQLRLLEMRKGKGGGFFAKIMAKIKG